MTEFHTPLAFFGSLGPMEVGLIFLLALLLFGAKKLPELARGMGKSMGEFKRAREEFEHEITRAEEEERTAKNDSKSEVKKETSTEKA